jgi:hypothetical protein
VQKRGKKRLGDTSKDRETAISRTKGMKGSQTWHLLPGTQQASHVVGVSFQHLYTAEKCQKKIQEGQVLVCKQCTSFVLVVWMAHLYAGLSRLEWVFQAQVTSSEIIQAIQIELEMHNITQKIRHKKQYFTTQVED